MPELSAPSVAGRQALQPLQIEQRDTGRFRKGDGAVSLEAREAAAHGLHGKAEIVGNVAPCHRQRDRTGRPAPALLTRRSEEHTSELQSLMRISYAVFCLKKKKNQKDTI